MTLLYSQAHELTWGALALDAEVAPDLPFRIDTMADGSTLGNPVPMVEIVESMLTDGSLSTVTSYGNREVTFRVRVAAPDGLALAQGESALTAEAMADRPAPLVWRPPSGDAWPCVFDVVTAKLDGDYSDGWDLDESMRACLYYTLTLECLPWTHPEETVIIPALPVPEDPEADQVIETVDDCESLAGWTGAVNPAASGWTDLSLTQSSGAVRYSGMKMAGTNGYDTYMSLTRTGAEVDMTTTPYLIVDLRLWSSPPRISLRFNGDMSTPYTPVAIERHDVTLDRWKVYFEAPESFTSVTIITFQPKTSQHLRYLYAFDISRTDRLPAADSDGYQVARTAFVGGTAPTQAAVRFATTLDGDPGVDQLMTRTAMIYTGANPAVTLRPLVETSAPTAPDASTVSGTSNNLSAPTVALVPVSKVAEANFALFARLKFTGTITVSWSANLVDSTGADFPGSDVVESGSMLLTHASNVWAIHQLGTIPLPILADLGDDSTHQIELTISMSSGGASVLFDDGWLLDDDNGAVTVINTTATTGPYKLELRSPQLDSPRPAIIGTWAAYGSQDVTRMADRMGTHLFKPGLLYMLTVADGMKYAPCELEYYERFHTRPGPALVPSEAM